MADDDAACSQHLLDHAQAERKAKVQLNRVAEISAGKRWPAQLESAGIVIPFGYGMRAAPVAAFRWS